MIDKDEFPKISSEEELGDKGLRIANNITCDQLGWIFRNQTEKDLGIDAYIEIVTESKKGTGRLIAIQIKCGKSYFEEKTEDGYIYRGSIKHLNYWLNFSLPVILVICSPESLQCLWVEISRSNTIRTPKGWKVLIPFNHFFDSSCKSYLREITDRPRHSDIARLLLLEFLYDRYGSRIEICPNLELPRDFQKSAYLAEIDNEITIIDYHFDEVGKISKEHIDDILYWWKYNKRVVSNCHKLLLFLISQSIQALDLDDSIKSYIESQKGITYFLSVSFSLCAKVGEP